MKVKKKYVKKLVSLNPDRFEKIDAYDALSKYVEYMMEYVKIDFDIKEMKSFKEWLETEI